MGPVGEGVVVVATNLREVGVVREGDGGGRRRLSVIVAEAADFAVLMLPSKVAAGMPLHCCRIHT
jgi:hypothetical protein